MRAARPSKARDSLERSLSAKRGDVTTPNSQDAPQFPSGRPDGEGAAHANVAHAAPFLLDIVRLETESLSRTDWARASGPAGRPDGNWGASCEFGVVTSPRFALRLRSSESRAFEGRAARIYLEKT